MKKACARMLIAWVLAMILAGCGRPPAATDPPAGAPVVPTSLPDNADPAAQPGGAGNDTPKATALAADVRHLGRTLPEWVADLSNPDAAARSQAADAVARYGPNAEAAVPALATILSDPEDAAWFNAQEAVRAVGPAAGRAVGTLVRLLRDRRPWVRLSAANTLGELGPASQRAVPELIVRLDDTTPVEGSSVRQAAAAAIVRVGKYDMRAVFEAEREGKLPDLVLFSVLRSLGPDDVESVGGLVDEVKRNDVTVFDALDGLERIGPKAAPALPALRTLHADKKTGQGLREALAKTISAIDRDDKTRRAAPAQTTPNEPAVEDLGRALAGAGFDEKAEWGRTSPRSSGSAPRPRPIGTSRGTGSTRSRSRRPRPATARRCGRGGSGSPG